MKNIFQMWHDLNINIKGFILICIMAILIIAVGIAGHKQPSDSNARIEKCYHNSECTTYIYLEQQVACYQGCRFALDKPEDCINKCVSYYNNTYRKYK
jgi:hypothetical protein